LNKYGGNGGKSDGRKTTEEKDCRVFVQEKLDGISALLSLDFRQGKIELFTRGDGKMGKDITFLYYFLNVFEDQKKTFQFLLNKNDKIR